VDVVGEGQGKIKAGTTSTDIDKRRFSIDSDRVWELFKSFVPKFKSNILFPLCVCCMHLAYCISTSHVIYSTFSCYDTCAKPSTDTHSEREANSSSTSQLEHLRICADAAGRISSGNITNSLFMMTIRSLSATFTRRIEQYSTAPDIVQPLSLRSRHS
jgi:hypothetical protein